MHQISRRRFGAVALGSLACALAGVAGCTGGVAAAGSAPAGTSSSGALRIGVRSDIVGFGYLNEHIPDPVAELFGGRTSTLFMCMWGALGFVWIKLCLPWLLKFINVIPWRARYSFTALCAVLMAVNGIMTLQALDCWFERLSGVAQTAPVERFYAEHFDNAYMEHRFESMTITPQDSSRIDDSALADAVGGTTAPDTAAGSQTAA